MGGKQQTAHFYEVRNNAHKRACFVSGCANSGGVKEVESFLTATVGTQRQTTREAAVPNDAFFSEQLSQQAQQASLLLQKMK